MKKISFLIGFVIMFMAVSAQWSKSTKENTMYSLSGELGNTQAKVAKTSDDMMYVSYTAGGLKFNTKLQLINKDGKAMWPNGGVLVSNHKSAQWTTGYTLLVTPDDCALIVLSDSRENSEKSIFQPYIYKINKSGEFLWGLDGVKIPYEGMAGYKPRMCMTNDGNTIVTFTDKENTRSLLCKLSPEGDIIWSELEIEGGEMANVVPSGNDGFIVVYYTTKEVMLKFNAQRYSANGEPMWSEPVQIARGGMFTNNEPSVLSDGEGGAVVLYNYGISNAEIYVMLQRVSVDGQLMMDPKGVKVSNTYELHVGGIFDIDTKRGEIFALESCYAMPREREMRVNKFDMYGEPLWGSEGVAFVDKIDWGYAPTGVTHTGDGGAILTYGKHNTDKLSEILGTKIEADGSLRWKDVVLCDVESGKSRAVCSPFFNNQVCVFWTDNRDGNLDLYGHIYGQNIGIDGTLGVIPVGVNDIAEAEGDVRVYPNPANSFITVESAIGSIEEVYLTDLSGRVVLTSHSCFVNIDVKSLKPGVYVVNTLTTEGRFTSKTVIK